MITEILLNGSLLLKISNKVVSYFLLSLIMSCTSSTREEVNHEILNLNSQEVSKWSKDIEYFHSQLEQNHINLYHAISKTDFESELSNLNTSLPDYNKYQVMVEMMRITRLIGDGHTNFGYWGHDYSRFPIYFKLFGDELRVIKTTPEYSNLIGKKLTSIDGTEVKNLIKIISPVVQGVDNIHSFTHFLPNTINVAEVLFGLKITKQLNSANFEFTDEDGDNQSLVLNSISHDNLKDLALEVLHERPVNLGYPLESTDGIWLSADDQTNTAYIKFNSYPGYLKMALFAYKVKEQLIGHQVKNLIIDLRENDGGNFFEGLVLAQMLVVVDNLDWEDGIYVLIGKQTFSAGVSNAAQFKQILNAKLVGEPTGGNPYGYQDGDSFVLPNSNWPVQYSKRFFKMQDHQTEGLLPDIKIETKWSDYKQSLDKQLEWVLNDISIRLGYSNSVKFPRSNVQS